MPFIIDPEVPGQIGPRSNVDYDLYPPQVTSLDFIFDGWLGDDIVQSFPVYLVTKKASDVISQAGLSGATFAYAGVSTSGQFRELSNPPTLPPFFWLKVPTSRGQADFWLNNSNMLCVSDKAMQVLQKLSLKNAVITRGSGI